MKSFKTDEQLGPRSSIAVSGFERLCRHQDGEDCCEEKDGKKSDC